MPFLLIAAPAPDEVDAVTRTGGRPLAPSGFVWPRCAQCTDALQFLAQVRLQDADPTFPDHLLLLFQCISADACETWDPTSGANHVACVPNAGLALVDPPATKGVVRPIDGVTLVPFDAGDDDIDGYLDARETFLSERRTVLGHVGDPAGFVNDPQSLECDTCQKEMRFVVQLEEGREADAAMNFGGGCAFGFVCSECFARGGMFWEQ